MTELQDGDPAPDRPQDGSTSRQLRAEGARPAVERVAADGAAALAALTWTPELVNRFWGYVSGTAMDDLSFSRLNGPYLKFVFKSFLRSDGRYIDFGAGDGAFARLLAKDGYAVGIYDPAIERQAAGGRLLKDDSHFLGSIDPGSGKRFDGVFLIEVFEHILADQLESTFGLIEALLADDGLLFLTTPNRENLDAGMAIDPVSGRSFHRWQHVRSSDKVSLSGMLAELGFEAVVMHEVEFTGRAFGDEGARIGHRPEFARLFNTTRSVRLGEGSGLVCVARKLRCPENSFAGRLPRLWDRMAPLAVPLVISAQPPRERDTDPPVSGWFESPDAFELILSPERMRREGLGWIHAVPSFVRGDSNQGATSATWVFEDGRPLGPAHSIHDEVRTIGGGRFCHWEDFILFSTSDDTSPLENGRRYTIKVLLPAA